MLGWANSRPWIWAWVVTELVSPLAFWCPCHQGQLSHIAQAKDEASSCVLPRLTKVFDVWFNKYTFRFIYIYWHPHVIFMLYFSNMSTWIIQYCVSFKIPGRGFLKLWCNIIFILYRSFCHQVVFILFFNSCSRVRMVLFPPYFPMWFYSHKISYKWILISVIY